MNIEQQATELVGNFREVKLKFYNVNPEFENLFYLSTIEAKQCAIICCDEIINNFGTLTEGKQHYASYATIQHYQQVKNYIETNL